MKVVNVKNIKAKNKVEVMDCFVDKGYLQGPGGQLPDVDIDYQSDRRAEIKEYIEKRYNKNGKQRVFSAGTLNTMKVKQVIKDVARVHRIPVNIVNYITKIFDDDKCDYTGIFKLAATNGKISKFIEEYPDLFEDIRTLMFQPRSASIHASAIIVTPDKKNDVDAECFDFVPIKKVDGVDGILVSEQDGYELDELGLLKNDCLATKELSKLQETMSICNQVYDAGLSLESIVNGEMDDEKAYSLLSKGYTQNIFQLSSTGMTKFLIDMNPKNIHDIIAANALYRPATLESGATESYIDCKSGMVAPTYLWGTYNALKSTFGLIVYQEQVSLIAREVGNFSLGDGVNLVKHISKKKVEKIQEMKTKFMEGAKSNGCPDEDAECIWKQIEACGSYLFNASHATAYAATSYAGAYLKANYPTAFYTTALQWADDDDIVTLMGEMESCSVAKVVPPDINVSGLKFHTDYDTDSIFWSLSKIKQIGMKTVEWIINEKEKNGEFSSIENFIDRIFKYKLKKYKYWDDPDNEEEATRCPVNARHILNLIFSGCFDKIENVGSVIERYAILEKAAHQLGFEIKEKDVPEEMRNKHYFWSQQQVAVSGIGSIDYKRIYDNSLSKEQLKGRFSYTAIKDIEPLDTDGKKVAVCVTVADTEERTFKDKKTGEQKTFCKLTVQQNTNMCECVVWPEEYMEKKNVILGSKGKIAIFSATVKYSDHSGKNNLQFIKNSILEVL